MMFCSIAVFLKLL